MKNSRSSCFAVTCLLLPLLLLLLSRPSSSLAAAPPPSSSSSTSSSSLRSQGQGQGQANVSVSVSVPQPQPLRRQNSRGLSEWPHSLILDITFDERPEEVSWKFENRRTSNVLAGVPFGEYPAETHANRRIVVTLDILNTEDYADDWMGSQPGVARDYRFVIYDRGGNGLCCEHGTGKYAISSKGDVVARGEDYGAIDEKFFSVDPRDYLGGSDDGSPAVVDVPRPSPATGGINGGAELPSMILGFFCGASFEEAEQNCPLPCPTGSPAECVRNGLEGNACFASTSCRKRWPAPTRTPSDAPTDPPTRRPTLPPTSRPTRLAPTRPAPTPPPAPSQPTTPSSQNVPTAQMTVDSNTWFCGDSWDWITDHCDEAQPCPRGDPVDCPANQACFASTPCTLSPTSSPTTNPSATPTDNPTPQPTRAPWSEASFLDFLYGQSEGGAGGGSDGQEEEGGGVGQGGVLASEVIQAVENYSQFQYHFFCGISWTHADETCGVFCPSGDRNDCPEGEECYANTLCDGRDTASPTGSLAPSPASGVLGGEICTLCDGSILDSDKSIAFQTGTVTCGEVDETVRAGGILVGSATCDNARREYGNSCCYDGCRLCRGPDGEFSDLRGERVVRQGGYEASCQEISTILSAAAESDDVCRDAQSQLGGECCYDQCTLCGDQSEMDTEWYATVTFQGLATTCLGIDYMLRTEQISDGSNQCSELRSAYVDRCCFVANSCQLCRDDDDNKLYEVDATKTIVTEQHFRSSFTTCTSIDDSLARLDKSDQDCVRGKQAFFGECCDLNDVIASNDYVAGPGGSSSDNALPNKGGTPQQRPSSGAAGGTSDGSLTAPSPASPAGAEGQTPSLANPASSGPLTTDVPTSESGYSWDQGWTPPNEGGRASVLSSLVRFGTTCLLVFFA